MKKRLLQVIALAVALTAGTALSVELIADGGDPLTAIDVGEVTVANDGSNLIVTFMIDAAGWEMVESHLHIEELDGPFPVTGNGNPKVGKFAHQAEHDPAVTSYAYTIPLGGLEVGDPLTIAAHCEVQIPVDPDGIPASGDEYIRDETAWGEGEDFAGSNWAMYFETTVPDAVIQ